MIGRVVLAALLAGIAAGFIMGAIQHVRLTPLIIASRNVEAAGGPVTHMTTPGPEAGEAGLAQPTKNTATTTATAGPRQTAGSARWRRP
jgi:predicted cobalt transporter CbtA